MNKSEFTGLIESFHKEPGHYTDDEIYQIGVAHKQLPDNDKDWAKLVNVLGVNKSPDALRCFIKNRQRRNQSLPKNVNLLSDRTFEDMTDADINNKKYELYRQQQKTRDEWAALRRFGREQSRLEEVRDAIRSSVNTLQNLPKVTYSGAPIKVLNGESVLMLSDIHMGAVVDSFYGKYNPQVARNRLQRVVDSACVYCKLFKVKRLHVLNLGDMINGLIHITARIEEQLDMVEQIMTAAEYLSDALNQLQSAAPEVYYRSCTDNHSRMVADLKQNIEKENLNRIIDWFIQERLKNTKIIFANDNLDVDIGKVDLMNGKKLVFVHGHRDKDLSRSILGISSKLGVPIDYLCLGHYHATMTKTLQKTLVFVNSSMMGSDSYASSIRLYGPASQTLLIFDNDNVLNFTINLDKVGE